MTAFAENPFFFIVDSSPPFLPVNVFNDPRKIVELNDVACNTRRSSLSALSLPEDSPVSGFVTKNHIKSDMHDEPCKYKHRRDDYYTPTNNGCRGVYCNRENRKNSGKSQPSWMINSRASPTTHQNYPSHNTRRKSADKKTTQNTMGHPERDVFSRYWADNAPGNYGKTHGKGNMDGYTVLRNQYEPVSDRPGFEAHRTAYQHGVQRGYPAGRTSQASTDANMSDGSKGGDPYMPRDRQTRWESMKSPMYNENYFMTPQQRLQANFVYENLEANDYSSERSDDSKRDRTRGRRIRSRTYSPPVDRHKYQQLLLRDQYNDDDDEEYFSMTTDNFPLEEFGSVRRNVEDIDGTMARDVLMASQLTGGPRVCETSSMNLMLDISGSSTLIGDKTCFDFRERFDNPWMFERNNDKRGRRNSVFDNNCSSDCCEYTSPKDSSRKKSAQSSKSKQGYKTFSNKNSNSSANTAPQRGSSYSVFPNKKLNEREFCIVKTVCTETNTDPLDFQQGSVVDARVLFTAEASQLSIHKSESCSMEKKGSQSPVTPNSAIPMKSNDCSKNTHETSPTETNKHAKAGVSLISSATASLKRKFSSTKEKSADEPTSGHHSIKDDAKRRKPETVSKLPVRIGARNKSRNPMPSSPSFESPASKQEGTGDRASSQGPEDRTGRTRTKPGLGPTSTRLSELSRSRQSRESSNYSKPESKELRHQTTTSNSKNLGSSRKPIKSLKESKSLMKSQQKRSATIDTNGKRESKYINLIRKPKQK